MNSFILFVLFTVNVPANARPEYIVGGETVSLPDPVRTSTVGIYTPSPSGNSGALCTGTLIRKDIALTAAHCISKSGPKPVVIFNSNLHSPNPNTQKSTGVLVNPKWAERNGRGMDQGDIALVKFGGKLPDGYKKISAVRSDSEIRSGQKVVLAGYGISDAKNHTGAGILRKTEVRVLKNRPGKSEMILDQSRGHGACHGDSGGPAFLRRNGKIVLAGLTNRSFPSHAPDDCRHQVIYTKVPAYRSWIQSGTKKLEAPQWRTRLHKGGKKIKRIAHKRKKKGSRVNS